MDRGNEYRHGFSSDAWEAAKDEACMVMRARARRGHPISYSDLVSEIESVSMDPHDPRLAHFLGQISRAEHEAGRGLLTAVVVHKHDGFPGDGFFELAESLGRSVADREGCWIIEMERLRDEAKAGSRLR